VKVKVLAKEANHGRNFEGDEPSKRYWMVCDGVDPDRAGHKRDSAQSKSDSQTPSVAVLRKKGPRKHRGPSSIYS